MSARTAPPGAAPSRWQPVTLRDHVDAARAANDVPALRALPIVRPPVGTTRRPAPAEPDASDALDALDENPTARCGCGRDVAADMLVDVRPLPPALLAALRARMPHHGDESPPAYACDGCRERLHLAGHVDRVTLARHLGAPPAVLERIAAKEAARAGTAGRTTGAPPPDP